MRCKLLTRSRWKHLLLWLFCTHRAVGSKGSECWRLTTSLCSRGCHRARDLSQAHSSYPARNSAQLLPTAAMSGAASSTARRLEQILPLSEFCDSLLDFLGRHTGGKKGYHLVLLRLLYFLISLTHKNVLPSLFCHTKR